ncbi:HlyD family type I secretion periplasmic adaptor subunit [Hydrogenophaga sp.]|uniref:HlyD family type I secretion periplasmic adaptor subunit n=1 Tax=Hydrogenophaga sp. TaxID=1904254 RepID=UPI002731ACE1|nr:HlyD family type I secretion periplasmic adaptor subunit [Hydrogenophaga sp.]MDP2015594.1 HlyD family type I secretion periplasmic adaptor subunit [Hydrogenophaga sp.]
MLKRYASISKLSWAHRHEMAGPARLADEAAFLPAALSLQETPVHPAPRRLAWLLIALFVIALLWAILGKVDIVAVAPGRVVVSERTKVIQPLEPSVVLRVLVKDGDMVQAGQLLVELDPTMAMADSGSVSEQLAQSQSELTRTTALIETLNQRSLPTAVPKPAQATFPPALQHKVLQQLGSEWDDIRARLSRLDAEIQRRKAELTVAEQSVARVEATLPMAIARQADYESLVGQGFVSSHATQDRRRERVELEQELATLRAKRTEVQLLVAESQAGKGALMAETLRNLRDRQAEAQTRVSQLGQESIKARQRESLTQLKAPVAGTVQQLAIHTPGGVVTEAQPLMVIVPEAAEVTAEVTLENKDIGFVSVGQDAEVKLETFPYTRYGAVPAEVQRVTADAVNDEKKGAVFMATLLLKQPTIDIDGKSVRISPGMSLTAEIKTGKRRVIEYLLSPVQRAGSESLRER